MPIITDKKTFIEGALNNHLSQQFEVFDTFPQEF